MKSDLHTISNLGRIIANRDEPEYARAFADMYWHALLLLAVGAVLGAGVFGVLQFFTALSAVSPDSMSHPSGISSTKTIDRAKMQEILDNFSERVSGVQGLQALPLTPLADPSK